MTKQNAKAIKRKMHRIIVKIVIAYAELCEDMLGNAIRPMYAKKVCNM